jgi:uncharacterized membrane protein YcaP (DUF421 family)
MRLRRGAVVLDLFPPDWAEIFRPEAPVLELFVRGSAMYLCVLVLMRIMPRRAGGELARMDLVFLLLIAEAATHALGDYSSVADALIVIASLMVWDYLINALSFRLPWFERLISAPPVQVMRDGELLRRNMRREYLTEDELMSFLRRQGIEDPSRVKAAWVEGEGRLSVIQRTGAPG